MADIQFDNVDSILSCFEDLKDPRSHINRLHIFGDLLVICIMAVIAGADGPEAISTWADSNHTWLKKHLQLPHGIPSHDTLGRLLAALKPIVFQACFQASIQTVAPLNNDGAKNWARCGWLASCGKSVSSFAPRKWRVLILSRSERRQLKKARC